MDTGVFCSRVGAAAFAVGLGLALASSPGVAAADESESKSSAQATESGPTNDSGSSEESSAKGTLSTDIESPVHTEEADEADLVEDVESAVGEGEPAEQNTDVTVDESEAASEAEVVLPEVVEPEAAEFVADPEPGQSDSTETATPRVTSSTTAGRAADDANGTNPAAQEDVSPTGEDDPAPRGADEAAIASAFDAADLADSADLARQLNELTDVDLDVDAIADAIAAGVASSGTTVSATLAPQPEVEETTSTDFTGTDFLSGLLAVLGIAPSAAGTDGPATPSAYVTAVLEAIRREVDRVSGKQPPTAAVAQSSQTGEGTGDASATAVAEESADEAATLAPQAALRTVASTATMATVAAVADGAGINSGNPGDELWGEAHFAPYVDMAGWPPPDLTKIAQDHGVSLLNLGFITATSDGKAAWGGYQTLTPGNSDEQAKTIDASIAAFKAAGGDVMISLGGAFGTTLAQSYAQRGLGAQNLADAYAGVVDTYDLNRVDFDIEGAAVAGASVALRSEAIALLQQQRPDLEVWYTLPVLPSGLTPDGLNVVDSALGAGVKLDGVNVMAMNYGEAVAPTSGPNAKTMGAYAIEAAESTHGQLSSLFARHGQEFGWNQLGVTPMIGVNDVTTEVFTVADAQALEDFAREKGLGMLSMWSVTRDNPGSLGKVTSTASGLDVPAGSFADVFSDYGVTGTVDETDSDAGPVEDGALVEDGAPVESPAPVGTPAPVEGGTTTVIGWHWGTDTVLAFDPAADKLDFGWFQPANFEVSEQSGSTRIEIVNNDQSYTLDGVGLGEMRIANIVALDANTVAKWQTLIEGAGSGSEPAPGLPSVSIGDAAGVEGDSGTADLGFTVSLSEASDDEVTVGYATANGTAVAGADYVAQVGTLTFAPGTISQVVNVGVVGDTAVESTETFTIMLSNVAGAIIGDGVATGTITNDDSASEPVSPGGGSTPVPVEGGTTTVIGWHWGTDTVLAFDPAADKLDFGWFQPTNFEVSEQSGSTRIEIVNNDQSYTLDGVGLGEMRIANIVALDANTVAKWQTLIEGAGSGSEPAPGLPSVSIGDAAGVEGDSGTADLGFTVSLSEASDDEVTVGYATANGTAVAGADYVAQVGTLTFAPGTISQVVNVGVVGDTAVESTETFTIMLSNVAGAVIGDGVATGTITNDDSASQPDQPSVPFGSHSKEYAPGTLIPTGSQATIDAAVVSLYNSWKSNFLVSAGDYGLAVRSTDADHPYVAEAQGYGMELTALMAGADPSAQASFDGILKYVLAHPSSINPDLHAAEQNEDFVSVNGGDSATDGDLSIAYALLLADEQWGSAGTYDYKQLALSRINAIKASEMDPDTFLPLLGDWNSPYGTYGNSTRPSDFMIDHFRAFKVATGDPFWDMAVTAAQELVTQQQETYAPSTGLIADFVVNTNTTSPDPAPAGFLEGSTDGQYSYNSVRVPWHIGTDAVVYGDATSKAQAQKITSWFRTATGDDPSKIVAGYRLDGTPAVNYLDPEFVATLGPAAMSDPANQAWLDAIWDYTVAQSQTSEANSYYSASLMLQSMIVMSGNYWAPGTVTHDGSNDPGTVDPGTNDPGEDPGEDPGSVDPPTQDPGSGSVSFTKTGDWGSGFNGDVTVTNAGTQSLSDWQVAFDFDGDISSIWNARLVSQTGDRYVVEGVEWNSDIAAGTSTSFGFTATAGSVTNLALNGAGSAGDPEGQDGPRLSVADTSVEEGDSGTSRLVFNVSLSAAADDVVTVNYRTEDLTAAAGSDYEATEGTLTFAAGETSKQVHVNVLGDDVYEGNESLLLVLSDITGAAFDDAQAAGLISNDDVNPNAGSDQEYRVVGYFTEWSIYGRGYEVADIPADKLTHINYAFADINDAGEVVLFDSFAAVEKSYPGDTWDQPVKGNFNQLAKLKEQNPDLEVLISIGGWTLSEDFSDVALTEASREKFAASAVDFITTYGFDGIDLDWEYPVEGGEPDNVYRPEDTANYVLLVEEIRRQLDLLEATDGIDDKEYLLTIASPAGYDKIANYDLAGMAPHLDWFQVMAYDFNGAGWSNQTGHLAGLYANPDSAGPLYNTDHAVSLYLQQVDPSKIVLGAPLYGHSWKGVPDDGNGGLNGIGTGAGVASYGDTNGNISYLHIVQLLEEYPDLYQLYWDDQAKASYLYNSADGTFISYESPEALQYRLDYIKELGLGGVMFWEIDDDVRDADDPRSMIGLAARELLGEDVDAV